MIKRDFLIFILLFICLSLCASQWVYTGDSAEFAVASATLSIGHPSGFPLYILLGKIWITLLFFMNPHHALSVASACYFTAAVGFSYYAVKEYAGNSFIAVAAAASVLLIPSIAVYSLVPEVYTLNLALLALCNFFAVHTAKNNKYYELLIFSSFLGCTNHITFVFFLPVYLFLGFKNKPTLKKCAACISILLWLYLPVRSLSNPVINWGEPDDITSFIAHVTGTEKNVSASFSLPPAIMLQQLKSFLKIYFRWIIPGVFASAGIVYAFFFHRAALLVLCGLSFPLMIFLMHISKPVSSRLHFYFPCFYLLGLSMVFFLIHQKKKIVKILASAVIILAGGVFYLQIPKFTPEVEQYYSSFASSAGPQGIILVENDELTFCDWYYRFVKKTPALPVVISRTMLQAKWYRNYCRKNFSCVPDTVNDYYDIARLSLSGYQVYTDSLSGISERLKKENPAFFRYSLIPAKGFFLISDSEKSPDFSFPVKHPVYKNTADARHKYVLESARWCLESFNSSVTEKLISDYLNDYPDIMLKIQYRNQIARKMEEKLQILKQKYSEDKTFQSGIQYLQMLAALGKMREGIKVSGEILDKFPGQKEVKYMQAFFLRNSGEMIQALNICENLLKNDEMNVLVLYEQALCRFFLKQYAESAKNLQICIRLEPAEEYFVMLAECYHFLKRPEDEKKVFEQALKKFHNSLKIQTAYAQYLWRNNSQEQALKIAQELYNNNYAPAGDFLVKTRGYAEWKN